MKKLTLGFFKLCLLTLGIGFLITSLATNFSIINTDSLWEDGIDRTFFGLNEPERSGSFTSILADFDNDGLDDLSDLDDDNDGILDVAEGCVGQDVDLGVDGTFEALAGVASGDAFNGNVTAGGWVNGIGSADSWISPMPTIGSGQWGGLSDGTPSSPDGGVFVGAWCSNGFGESFYIDISGLLIGQDYILRFYQVNAGIEGLTVLNNNARWEVNFGSEVQFSTELPYLGEGNQVWFEEIMTFTATQTTQRLEFIADAGTDGITGSLYDNMGIDGVRLFEAASTSTACTGQDTDGDGSPDHLDNDADGDGCPDALEGTGTFVIGDLDANDQLTGGVDANGIPLVATASGQGVGSSIDPGVQSCPAPPPPASDNALSFNSNDWVGVANSSDFNVGASTDFTIQGIVQTTFDAPGASRTIFSKMQNGTIQGYQLWAWQGKLLLEWAHNGAINLLGGTTTITDGQCHHVAVVVDRTAETVKLYVDGVLDATQNNTAISSNIDNSADVFIGKERTNNSAFFWRGEIDELAFFTSARTDAEIAQSASNALTGSESGLLAYWKFDSGVAGADNSGVTTAIDETGGNDGTLNGFSLDGSETVTGANGTVVTGTWVASTCSVDPSGLQFVVGTETSGPSNTVIVPITVNDFDDVATYQGTITFDPNVLTFVDATSPLPGGTSSFGDPGVGTIPANSITFSWYDPSFNTSSLPDGTVVMELEFTVAANATTGFTDVQINGSATPLGYSTDPAATVLSDPTVTQGGVTIDADAPTVDIINIVSNNVNDITLATIADVITLSFTTSETPAQAPVVTIVEGGPGAVTLAGSGTSYDATKTVASGGDGLVTFSIQIEDQYGNSSTATATTDGSQVIVDTEAPTITCPNPIVQDTDANVCGAVITFATPSGDDNLVSQGYAVSVSQTAGDPSGTTFPTGTSSVTFTVTDAAGNTADCSFDITVNDNEAPNVITQPFTVQLDANGTGSITVSDIDNGSTDACGIDTRTLDVSSFTCADVGLNTVTLTVTDVNGNPASATAIVTVEDNIAPNVITQPYTVQLDASGSGSITVDDIDNGSSDACGIASRSLDVSSFSCADVGQVTVTLTVTDNNGNPASQTATVTVEDNVAPEVITQPYTVILDANGNGSITVDDIDNGSNDACGIASRTLDITTFDCSDVGGGSSNTADALDFDGSNDYVLLPQIAALSNATQFTLEARITLNSYQGYAPIFTQRQGFTQAVQLQMNSTGNRMAFNVGNGTDGFEFGSTVLSLNQEYLLTAVFDGSLASADRLKIYIDGAPETISNVRSNPASTGNLSGTPIYLARENNAYSPIALSEVRVWDVARSASQVATTAANEITSAQSGLVAHYRFNQGIPNGNNASETTLDDETGSFNGSLNNFSLNGTSSNWIGNASGPTTQTVTLTVTDVNGNTASETAEVTVVDNIAPNVVTQAYTVQLDANGNGSITVDDIDNGSSDACGIDTRSLDITSFSCADIGDNTVTLTVTDVNGNTASETAIVTVEDNVAPNVITQAFTLQLDASGNGTLTVDDVDNGSSDACGIASRVLDVSSFTCANIGNNTVTLTVTDANGNVASETAIVTVEDNVAPNVITQAYTVQLDANGNGSITVDDIDNGSSDACGINTRTLDISSFGCGDVGDVTVTLTVTDVNGNTASETAIVTVEDNVAPNVVTQPFSVQLDASGNASITVDDIDDNSTDACGIASRVLDITSFTCANVGANTVTLTVTDVNGNSASATATVTVLDDPIIDVSGKSVSEAGHDIPGVIYDLAGDDGPQTTTGLNYTFQVAPCGSTNDIGGDKVDDAATNNGVDVLDAFDIVKHLLLIEQLGSPYKLIAADVNATGSINILDAFQVLRKVNFIIPYFTNPTTGAQDAIWTFIPDDYVFADPLNPWNFETRRDILSPNANLIDQDFIGVKLGDVNESWNPNVLRTAAPSDSMFFNLDGMTAEQGELIRIPVKVNKFNAITGYQFTLNWDPSVLEFQEVNHETLEGVYGLDNVRNGIMTTAWVDFSGESISLEDGTVAFEMVFKAVGGKDSKTEFKITSDVTASKAYDITRELVGIGFASEEININRELGELAGYSFDQNVPNPFGESTNLLFSISKTEKVQIVIYNLNGQLIKRFDGTYAAGDHQIKWDGRNEKGMEVSEGIYMAQMVAGDFSAAIRISKNR